MRWRQTHFNIGGGISMSIIFEPVENPMLRDRLAKL